MADVKISLVIFLLQCSACPLLGWHTVGWLMAFVPCSYKATPCRYLQPLCFFQKGQKWRLWGATCCSGHLTPLALEQEGHGQGVKPNPFQPWCCTVLQMLTTSCCASISFGEAKGSPGADRENPKKPPQLTNLKVISWSNEVNLMEEKGWLPCELMSERAVALSGGTE